MPQNLKNLRVVGIALAKRVFHVAGMDNTGHIVLRQRWTREVLMPCVAQLPPVVIGLQACGSAHDWARRCRTYSPTGKLMAPQCVKPSVKANTHDPTEAEAIAEAVTRPPMRFVPITEVERTISRRGTVPASGLSKRGQPWSMPSVDEGVPTASCSRKARPDSSTCFWPRWRRSQRSGPPMSRELFTRI